MKRFYTTLAMVIVCAIASFAQLLPQAPAVPYTGIMRSTPKTIKADDVLVTLPETAVVEDDWAIDALYYYFEDGTPPFLNDNPISVAFDGVDVYFKGVVYTCPNAWIKGKMLNNVASFASGQYCGTYNDYNIYACGTSDLVNFSSFRFQYDPVEKSFTLADFYLENVYPDQQGYIFFSYRMKIYKNVQVPTPTDLAVVPEARKAQVSWNSEASKSNLRFRKMVDVTANNRSWDFEDENQAAEFTLVDADGDGKGWAWINSQVKAHSGTGIMYSMSYDNTTGALTPDNWIISPKVKLGGQVSLWACSQEQSADYANEQFQIYVLEGDTWSTVDDFIAVSDIFTTTVEYQQFTADLSAFEDYGYIAIRHFNCTDQFWLDIDDIEVTVPDASGAVQPEWTVYEDVVNPFTINNLEPSTEYEVQVCGVEDGVLSLWTPSVVFTTLPEGTVEPTIDELYMVGTFNDWNTTEGRIPLVEVEEGVFEAKADLPANAEFKLITFNEEGSPIWMGGTDDTGSGHYDITQELLNVPTPLYVDAGANFLLATEPAVYKVRVTQAETTTLQGLTAPLLIEFIYYAPTAIDSIGTDAKVDNTWYNLQGVKLSGKPSTPGIYINAGKKVIVK